MGIKRCWLILKIEGTKEVLILKRSNTSRNKGQWDFIGGSSKGKIKPRKLIRKEALEEIGFIPKLSHLLTLNRKLSTYHYFMGTIKKGKLSNIQLNHEHSKFDTLDLIKLRKKKKLHHSIRIYLTHNT